MFELNRAIAASERGDTDRALSLFQDYLTDNPDDATGHTFLALTLLKTGQLFSAWEESRRALAADPDLAMAHLVMAQVATFLNDPVQAEKSLENTLRIDPENADALLTRCMGAMRDKDAVTLRSAARALLSKTPDDEMPYYFLSHAEMMSGNGQEAEELARQALRIAPDDARSHEAIGWASVSYTHLTLPTILLV